MGWNVPTTAIAQALLTSSMWNTDVRDNSLELRRTPYNRCVAYSNATQAVTTGNNSALTLNAEEVDSAVMHDLVTNNSRITIPSPGSYRIHGVTQAVNASAATTATLHLRKNGTAVRSSPYDPDPSLSLRTVTLHVFAELDLVAGDYLELYGQAVGATVTFGSATAALATRLSVIGPLPPA